MSKIFICYRRQDNLTVTIIHQRLEEEFGKKNVFRDLDTIAPGEDFRDSLERALDDCNALLVVMNKGWADFRRAGGRCLDDPEDYVRQEIETSFEKGVLIVPLLLEDAKPPKAEELPKSLQELSFVQAARLRGGRDFKSDMTGILAALRDASEREEKGREELEHFKKVWEGGDWLSVHQVLESVVGSESLRFTRARRLLTRRQATVNHLHKAAGLLEKCRFEEAQKSLQQVPQEEQPPNLEAALQIAQLGMEASREKAAAEDARGLLKRFEEVTGGPDRTQTIPGEREVADLLTASVRDARYRDARLLYEEGIFSSAGPEFDELKDYKDSALMSKLCRSWRQFHQAFSKQKWLQAREALEEIRDASGEHRARKWVTICNKMRIIAPVLERMAAGSWVRDPRVPWQGGLCPYKALNINPVEKMEECNELSYDLQSKPGGMTQPDREAWDGLRLIEKRLQVDFALYRVYRPERARELLQELSAAPEGTKPEAVDERIGKLHDMLGEDQGIYMALRNDYEGAKQYFLALAKERPFEPRVLHHLGLAAAGETGLLRDRFELMDADWDVLVVAWGAVFADERFWHDWWIERRQVYPVDRKQIETAREELQRFWHDEIKAVTDQFALLDVEFQAEMAGARAINAGGGIPLQRESEHKCVAGYLGVRQLGLVEAVASWTGTFSPDCPMQGGWQGRACIYYSQLASAQALFEDGRDQAVLELLEKVPAQRASLFRELNPGFAGFDRGPEQLKKSRLKLIEDAHLNLAVAAISESPLNVDQALQHWREAVKLAGRHRHAETLREQIRQVCLGRARYLQDSEEEDKRRQLDSLNDAVRLLQDAINEGWDNQERKLWHGLVDALLDRAVFMSNEFDAEKEARRDAQRAWGMAPESVRSLSVLCTASLHWARQLLYQGKRPLAEALIKEVREYLHKGENLFPSNPSLAQCARYADEVEKFMAGDGLVDLMKILPEALDAEEQRERDRVTEAMVNQVQGNFQEAVELYWGLVQENPNDAHLRGRLAWCYRLWIQHERSRGATKELSQIISEALERCPDSEDLSDVIPDQEE